MQRSIDASGYTWQDYIKTVDTVAGLERSKSLNFD